MVNSLSSEFIAIAQADVLLGQKHDDRAEPERAAAVLDDLVAAVVLDDPAEGVAAELWRCVLERRRKARHRQRHDGLPHFAGAVGGEEPLLRTGQLPGRQLQLQPARDVVGAGRDRARRADVRAERDLLLVEPLLCADAAQLADAAVRESAIRSGEPVDVVGHARLHAERREDARLDEVLPGLAGNFLDQLAGDGVEHVVVGIAQSENWSSA